MTWLYKKKKAKARSPAIRRRAHGKNHGTAALSFIKKEKGGGKGSTKMEERSLELDDDGKIRLRRTGEEAGEVSADDIVIDIPDYKGFEEEEAGARFLAREGERRRAGAQAMLAEADELFAAGDLLGAGEKYLDCAALDRADWRPWFGVVRVHTKDLTDFSGFGECSRAFEKAVRRMGEAGRKEVAARYGEQLSLRAEECGMRVKAQAAADEEKRAAERPQVMRAYGRALRSFAVVAALFLAFAVASAVLFPLIDAVPGYQVLIAAVVCGAAALVLLVAAAALGRRFWRAFSAKRRNERAGSTPEGRLARLLAEEEECIRMILEDIM